MKSSFYVCINAANITAVAAFEGVLKRRAFPQAQEEFFGKI